jgi:hypothetical protein
MANQYRRLPNMGGTPREVAEVVNNLVEGKINSTGEITLASSGATSTTLIDQRISPNSVILFMPTTLSAAASNKYPFGLFEDDAAQTFAAANTPYVLNITESEYAYGTSLASNQITVDYAGLYNISVGADFVNSSSQIHDAYMWLRVNGTNVPHSTAQFGVSDKQGSTVGATPVFTDHPLDLNAGDYVEVVVAVSSTTVSLAASAAQTTPYARPSAPSVMVEITMTQPSQSSGSAFELYVSAQDNGQATISHLPNSETDKTYKYVILG